VYCGCIVLFGRDEPIDWIAVLKLRVVVLAELAITSCASVWQRPKMKAFHDALLWGIPGRLQTSSSSDKPSTEDFCGSFAPLSYSESCIDEISCA
jgi:hypothetical protein